LKTALESQKRHNCAGDGNVRIDKSSTAGGKFSASRAQQTANCSTQWTRDELILRIPVGPIGPMGFPWEWEVSS